jgi:hypothetical protein
MKRGSEMILAELPRLKSALDLMGLDNGANVVTTATIPADWEVRARLAEDELLHLRAEQVVTLTQGEQTEMEEAARRAPRAYEIINAAFDDGPLAQLFFEPWQNIFDARDAENRIARQRKPRP